jgi:hypothetical protein
MPEYGQPMPEYGQPAYGQPAYGTPPPKKSRTGLIIGIVGGAVAVIVLLVIGLAALGGGAKHDVAAADSAGGWQRDSAGESRFGSTIDQQKSTLNSAAKGKLDKVVSAYYKDPNGSTTAVVPAGVIFIGGTGETGGPTKFVSDFRSVASAGGTVTEVDPGPGGGKGVCAEIHAGSQSVAFCAWATDDSFGEVVSTTPGKPVGDVAEIMRKMRPDLEHEK